VEVELQVNHQVQLQKQALSILAVVVVVECLQGLVLKQMNKVQLVVAES
jgi:cation transporter-like permease